MPRVYDLSLVFQELELFEIRLHELDPVVDVFGIIEASTTFSGNYHAPRFNNYAERWPEFADRIRYRYVDLPEVGPWLREEYQRNQLGLLLHDARPRDLVLVSDVDEIPTADSVRRARRILDRTKFDQRMSQFYVNHVCIDEPWRGTSGIRYQDWTDAQAVRMQTDMVVLEDGGWHFSYLGGYEMWRNKIVSYSHALEFAVPEILDEAAMRRRIAEGQDVFMRGAALRYRVEPLDSTYPAYLLANLDRFAHLIEPLPDRQTS